MTKFNLHGLHDFTFSARAKLWVSRQCPNKPDWWDVDADQPKDVPLSFRTVVINAGLHFASSINKKTLAPNVSARQRAADVAWAIISCLNPSKDSNGRLCFSEIRDQDIKKLASEILGVGAGITFLNAQQCFRLPSLLKETGFDQRFDFYTGADSHKSRIFLEFKGTCNWKYVPKHRESISEKMQWAYEKKKGPLRKFTHRTFSRAIGTIFCSHFLPRSANAFDFEIVDPEFTAEPIKEDEIQRRVTLYYREVMLLAGAEKMADRLTEYLRLIDINGTVSQEDCTRLFPIRNGSYSTTGSNIFRTSLNLGSYRYYGSFWNTAAFPLIMNPEEGTVRRYSYCFVGIEANIIDLFRTNKAALLFEKEQPEHFFKIEGIQVDEDSISKSENRFSAPYAFDAIVSLSKDGLCFVWTNVPPSQIDLTDFDIPKLRNQ